MDKLDSRGFPIEAVNDIENFWIPLELSRMRGVNPLQKVIYGYVLTRSNMQGVPIKSSDISHEFTEMTGHRNIRICIMNLVEIGLLYKQEPDPVEIEAILRRKTPSNGAGHFTCSWCGSSTAFLHEHHHPVSKSNGGTKTVPICPNCHGEFHQQCRTRYSAKWPL